MPQQKPVVKKTTKKSVSPTSGPTYKNLGLARTATNNAAGRDTNTPATRKDSLDYKKGFEMGKAGYKPNPLRTKYEGKNQYEEKGRWEGQNAVKKKPVKTAKSGSKINKAKNGTSLGMKSVKAGYDKNPGVTRADIITAAKGKAKSGASMKKCKYGCK